VIAYASRTGTRRNLDALSAAGWRLLVSARGRLRCEGFPYALDNGAWTAHTRSEPFNVCAFVRAVEEMGSRADFVVAPDIVMGGRASLELTRKWLPWCLERCDRVLIAVQDGHTPDDVRPLLSDRVGVAIGGSTEWKEDQLARQVWRASWVHVLRVNTARRVHLCSSAGADSFDGSGVSRFVVELGRVDAARRQESFKW